MGQQFYIKKVSWDNDKQEFIKILLQNKSDHSLKEWDLSEPLMDFSMENDFYIENDPQANILVYTAKRLDGSIKFTVKAFYKGNQENLLLKPEYIQQFLS